MFIVDANVLIDFLAADLELLKLVSVQQVYVASAVVDEVKGLTDAKCAAHGLQIVHGTLAQQREAANHANGLTFEDRLCLILARDAGWACVTNDGALRTACTDAGVNVVWGLELVLKLVAARGATKQRARSTARAIHASNPFHITAKIIAAFEEKLASVKRSS